MKSGSADGKRAYAQWKHTLGAATVLCLSAWTAPAWAQATSRQCDPADNGAEQPGPACLLQREPIGKLASGAVWWRLYTYPDMAAARRDQPPGGTIATAFGDVWLFTIGARGPLLPHGRHVADVGPIPVEAGDAYVAEYLRSTFSPGMTAPVHVHSGPEAFYAISGDTCLETPDGMQTGRGPGNSLMIRAGPPMLLMAPGPEPRRGFALILHDGGLPPTTLVHDWKPAGLCRRAAPTPAP